MYTHYIPPIAYDALLLVIRAILALSFIVASRNKARNIKKFAKENGLPVAGARMVALTEMATGVAVLLGIFPQLAAGIIILLMLGTIRLHIFKWKSPYWAVNGGWEYDLMLLSLAAVVVLYGGGAWSLYASRI